MPVTLTRPFIYLTDAQLEEELKKHEPGSADYSSYLAEIKQRQVDASIHRAAKLHWIVWATFIVTLLGLAISAIGYWPQLKAFSQSPKSYFHDPSVR